MNSKLYCNYINYNLKIEINKTNPYIITTTTTTTTTTTKNTTTTTLNIKMSLSLCELIAQSHARPQTLNTQ